MSHHQRRSNGSKADCWSRPIVSLALASAVAAACAAPEPPPPVDLTELDQPGGVATLDVSHDFQSLCVVNLDDQYCFTFAGMYSTAFASEMKKLLKCTPDIEIMLADRQATKVLIPPGDHTVAYACRVVSRHYTLDERSVLPCGRVDFAARPGGTYALIAETRDPFSGMAPVNVSFYDNGELRHRSPKRVLPPAGPWTGDFNSDCR